LLGDVQPSSGLIGTFCNKFVISTGAKRSGETCGFL
jgi:hypothetical protein